MADKRIKLLNDISKGLANIRGAINQQTNQLLQLVTGSVVRHMSAKSLKTVKVPLPPLPLQQQFVEIAIQAEATKESLRKSIENIDQVIKSLINQ